ncbi:phosphorothioated DNA-binding restriction endonuclease [Peribacillus alkalitolerans]|uniref:phosphorothioated DNA-binding restriction endonuclease n=1 Tax=Peribacillus alkalitolerans TaxID=1550385 RepID=UPI0013D89330|nr:HNH endonuclease [Peribacillus alkalitolerans]
MNEKELKSKIHNLSIWKKGDQRAPHKPLLILYALGQLQQSHLHMIPYEMIREHLRKLLQEFGPSRKSHTTVDPFIRLTKDGIWVLDKESPVKEKALRDNNVHGGFTYEVYNMLKDNNLLIKEVAQILLEEHFPDTLHEDLLSAVGLDIESKKSKSRDPKFREKILRAYEYSCAVCGFNVRLDNNPVGIEAAHIKWHQAGGPDNEENGIALCSLHHKLFDRGVFTLTDNLEFIVAEAANGNRGFDEWLMRYHGQFIRKPINPTYYPEISFVNWHVKEVFKGPGRYSVNKYM